MPALAIEVEYLLNASDYSVPQDRKRVIFVGYRNDLNKFFTPPEPITPFDSDKIKLKDTIGYDEFITSELAIKKQDDLNEKLRKLGGRG